MSEQQGPERSVQTFDMDIDIDICGACNLCCPCCPQGNVGEYRLPQGFLAPELLERIVAKAASECRSPQISLYNWAEPLLHPRLPELVRIVQQAGFPCHLSSNLNLLPQIDALLAANPSSLRISNSGFSQAIYGRTHRGGDIEKVKRHMIELAAAKERTQADTAIHVYYHRYRHNLEEEGEMRAFAHRLGFNFHAVWSLFFPLEKVLALAEDRSDAFALTVQDRELIDSLALPLQPALQAAQRYAQKPCPLRERALSLDFQGNATLCCGVFDAGRYTLGNYLELPLTELQQRRRAHSLCERCMRQGAHVYMTYGMSEIDQLALANLDPERVKRLGLRSQLAGERRRQRLMQLYNRYGSGLLTPAQKAALTAGVRRLQSGLQRLRQKESGRGGKP